MLSPSIIVLLLALTGSYALTEVEPRTITLSSRRGPSRRTLRRRLATRNMNVPLADDFLGTDLEWFGNISVGTPPQVIPVVWDTGSSTPEFASTLCDTCIHQIRFNSSQSSTFVDLNQTGTIVFATGGGVAPVIGNNTALTLREATDTVSVGGFTVPNVTVFLVTNQTEVFNRDPYSGIVGLGSDGSGLFGSLIKEGLPSLFSMFLTPKSIGNAELTLGGIDHSKFKGPLTFATLFNDGFGDWVLPSPGISVNGKTTPLLHTPRNVIFDSGTSNVLFSTNTTEAIYSLISPEIKPNPAEPGTYGIACNRIHTLPAKIDIAFTSQEGKPFNLTIPSSELSVGPFANNASLCQTLINAFDGLELVGGSLLKHYYTVFDVGNQRMGFAPSC